MRVLLLLLLINAIKLPVEYVPVVVVEDLHASALATPWAIFIKEDSYNKTVIDHEYCHIEQMNKYGGVWFLVLNAYELYTKGYDNNMFEAECYALELRK